MVFVEFWCLISVWPPFCICAWSPDQNSVRTRRASTRWPATKQEAVQFSGLDIGRSGIRKPAWLTGIWETYHPGISSSDLRNNTGRKSSCMFSSSAPKFWFWVRGDRLHKVPILFEVILHPIVWLLHMPGCRLCHFLHRSCPTFRLLPDPLRLCSRASKEKPQVMNPHHHLQPHPIEELLGPRDVPHWYDQDTLGWIG